MDLIATPTAKRIAGRSETAVAVGLAGLLVVLALLVTPGADRPGPVIPGFMPGFAGAMVVIDLVLAVLLFSKGAIARRAGPIRLGTAYLFAALIIPPPRSGSGPSGTPVSPSRSPATSPGATRRRGRTPFAMRFSSRWRSCSA